MSLQYSVSLTRRLTEYCNSQNLFKWYFNSQPHKEADQKDKEEREELRNFNSQPHKEADEKQILILYYKEHFNSQPHKEADFTPTGY